MKKRQKTKDREGPDGSATPRQGGGRRKREEIKALRERLTRLSEASRRINESLDFEKVLQEVLDSACSLAGARYGIMTLPGDSGEIEDFLSSGMTAEESEGLWDLPERWQFFEFLSSSEPLRVPDLLGHIRSAGLPEFRPVAARRAGRVLPGRADPSARQAGREYLCRRERGRGRVHPRGRGTAGDVRRASGNGHRQCPHVPGGTPGPGGSGEPDQHLAGGGRRLRREDGRADVVQSGGHTDRRRPAGARPVAGATSRRSQLRARGRTGGLPRGAAAGRAPARR